jgi:hypothetical protein
MTDKEVGVDLRKTGRTSIVKNEQITNNVVKIIKGEETSFFINNRKFNDWKELSQYLSNLELNKLDDGIILSENRKDAIDNDYFEELVNLCIKINIDLFLELPTSRRGGPIIIWIVRSNT